LPIFGVLGFGLGGLLGGGVLVAGLVLVAGAAFVGVVLVVGVGVLFTATPAPAATTTTTATRLIIGLGLLAGVLLVGGFVLDVLGLGGGLVGARGLGLDATALLAQLLGGSGVRRQEQRRGHDRGFEHDRLDDRRLVLDRAGEQAAGRAEGRRGGEQVGARRFGLGGDRPGLRGDGLGRHGGLCRGGARRLDRCRFGGLLGGVRRRWFGGGLGGWFGERVAHRLRDRAVDVRLGAARVGAELTQLGQDALA